MREHNRRRDIGFSDPGTWLAVGVVAILAVVIVGVNLPLRLSERWWPSGQTLEANWFVLPVRLVQGHAMWTGGCWWVLACVIMVMAVACVAVGLLVRVYSSRRSRFDWAAKYMGWGREIDTLTRKNAEGVARRLGVSDGVAAPVVEVFDRTGDRVSMSGTATPGWEVQVLTHEQVIGSCMADEHGCWQTSWSVASWEPRTYAVMVLQSSGPLVSFVSDTHPVTIVPVRERVSSGGRVAAAPGGRGLRLGGM